MDEESVGILGVLLIVTVLVMSQGPLHKSYAAPALHAITWTDIASVFGCSEPNGSDCRPDVEAVN